MIAAAGREMVARGKFHVVDVKASQPVGQRGQMFRTWLMKPRSCLICRVAAVVPVINMRRGKFPQQHFKIGFHRQFPRRASRIFDAEDKAAFFGFAAG